MRRILTESCVAENSDSDFELFWGWMNKSLGGLRKDTRDILKQKKKEDKKEWYS